MGWRRDEERGEMWWFETRSGCFMVNGEGEGGKRVEGEEEDEWRKRGHDRMTDRRFFFVCVWW